MGDAAPRASPGAAQAPGRCPGGAELSADGANAPLPFADRSGRATLRTIAELAGVHVTTVSRVLQPSSRPDVRAASAETTDRIRSLAAQLSYVPNPHATGLRTQRSNLIGVVVPLLSDLVLATVYEGIEEAAAEHNYFTLVTNSRDDPRRRSMNIEMLLGRRAEGLILGDVPLDPRLGDELEERGVAFVLVSRRAGDHLSVTCDDYQGGRLVADHLLALGHERPAIIAGQPYASTGVDRTQGFLDRYAEAGLTLPATSVLHSRFDVQGGRSAAGQLLATRPTPTALFAVNDFAAIGAFGALRQAELEPGRDLALVGFNDVPLAAELPVPLTSVRSPMRQMGRRALEMLLDRLAGRPTASERLQPVLIARESSGPALR